MLKKTFLISAAVLMFFCFSALYAQTASQTLTLKTGFNFVSFNLRSYISPQELKNLNPEIDDFYAFSAAAGSFISASEGTLVSIGPGRGYIIKANNDKSLNTSGIPAGAIGDIVLKTGFNLTGISKPVETITFSALMAKYPVINGMYKWSAASGSFIQVVRDASKVPQKLDGIDPVITSGQAYFISVSDDTTMNYDNTAVIIGGQAVAAQDITSTLAWKYNDPGADAAKQESVTAGVTTITLAAPTGNDLYNIYNYNAPRYTKSVSGDFIAYARVFPTFTANYNGAGIIVEDTSAANKSASLLRFEYAYDGKDYFASLLTPLEFYGQRYSMYLHDIYLKVERKGDAFTYYARDPNVSAWTKVSEITYKLSPSIDVGVYIVNNHNSQSFSAYFTNFTITKDAAAGNPPLSLTLAKTSDQAGTSSAYDLTANTAWLNYSDGSSRSVTPSWEVLIGSGTIQNGKYNTPASTESVVIKASYTENGYSASALLKLSVAGPAANAGAISSTQAAEYYITNSSVDGVLNAAIQGEDGRNYSCSLSIPAGTLGNGAAFTIGKCNSTVPVKNDLDPAALKQAMPPIVISALAASPATLNKSIYLDIPLAGLGGSTANLVMTSYDGVNTKFLAGRVENGNFRVEIPPSYMSGQATLAPAAPTRQAIAGLHAICAIAIIAYISTTALADGMENIITIANEGKLTGVVDPAKHNVILIHGIFSQTEFLGTETNWLRHFLPYKGYNVLTFNYKFWDSNYTNGKKLADAIITWGRNDAPFTILCHSMGGLVSREALINLKAAGKIDLVDKIVFLSTPNRGGKAIRPLGEWQQLFTSGLNAFSVTAKLLGMPVASGLGRLGSVISSSVDHWPVGFLQLIGSKAKDSTNFLAHLNSYDAGRDYPNIAYYAMVDVADEYVDAESIDFKSYYKTDNYPYGAYENFKNKSDFALIAKSYDPSTEGFFNNHSATHNLSLFATETDMLKLLKTLKRLLLDSASISVKTGNTYNLSMISVAAQYKNLTTENITPQWYIKSGGGSVNGTTYTAPAAAGNAVLVATYRDKDVTATAEVSVSITAAATPDTIIIDLGNGVTIELPKIPAGSFMMGSPDTEAGRQADEGPVHKVNITRSFYLSKFEITQKQWTAVMGSNPTPSAYGLGDNYPVIASWDSCKDFISKLNAKKLGFGTFDMPTEAEWEYACRAGTTTAYYCGDTFSDSIGWYSINSKDKLAPVGLKTPNLFGLYDMSGNAGEHCSDWYNREFYTPDEVTDPKGPDGPGGSSTRICRGGSFLSNSTSLCRSAERLSDYSSGVGQSGLRLGLYK